MYEADSMDLPSCDSHRRSTQGISRVAATKLLHRCNKCLAPSGRILATLNSNRSTHLSDATFSTPLHGGGGGVTDGDKGHLSDATFSTPLHSTIDRGNDPNLVHAGVHILSQKSVSLFLANS